MLQCSMATHDHDDLANSSPAATGRMEDDQHSAPPQVYRSKVYPANEGEDWIVEPPRNMLSTIDKIVFTGSRAQQLALTYAYERFGNARFFPYSRGTR
jgi:hypothetical protein